MWFIDNHTTEIFLSLWVSLEPHVVDCFNIYNTFVVLTIDKPRILSVVIVLHHIIRQQYGQTLRLVIYRHKGKCNYLIIILLLFCLLSRVPLEPHVVDCLHILNIFFVLTTDKTRLFTVVILLHNNLCQQYGRTLHISHLPTQR